MGKSLGADPPTSPLSLRLARKALSCPCWPRHFYSLLLSVCAGSALLYQATTLPATLSLRLLLG